MAFPFPDPVLIEAEVFTELPENLRRRNSPSYWAQRNRGGMPVDSFIEGPSFDLSGNLWFVDIPFGRIMRATPNGTVTQVAEYEGQPNGLKIDASGRVLIADFQNGIMRLDPNTGRVLPLLCDADSEGFKGCNDLHLGSDGSLFFTDQGQTGLQDPTGRVYRWREDSGRLDCLIDTVPSPNGLVLNKTENILYLAVTRSNAVWRVPLTDSGRVAKAGLFLQFSGGRAGPDGLALTADGGVVVCQTGMGLVWIHNEFGVPVAAVKSPKGLGTTNCAFGGSDGKTLFITESDTGTILAARVPVKGQPMASGWGNW